MRWMQRLRSISGLDVVFFGLAAIALGWMGQRVLTPGDRPNPNADISAATRWYVAAIWLLIIGWSGTYRNISLLGVPARIAAGLRGAWLPRPGEIRLALIGCALLWNLLALLTLHADWTSGRGAVLWVISLIFLVLACVGERPERSNNTSDVTEKGWRLPLQIETAIFVLIMVVAVVMRLWRLGDLTPGMHGDEGEAGSDALAIMHGQPAPLFARGWFNQPNMYYWSLVVFMKIFGTGLVGLRSFVVVCGLVTVVFTYLLGREMFGQRGAIVAGFFMAFQSADLLFSRQEFSNGTTPALFVMAFYFVVRGLRTRRHMDFVWAGFSSGFSLYYFAGGRLVSPVVLMFLGYLAVTRRAFLKAYWTHVVAYVGALTAMIMPFVGYYVAYPILGLQYPNDRFIWLHHADLAVKYGSSDWKVILWRQFQATISILTQGVDVSAMGALSFPIARPIEAVLVVLGLAWAAFRWRDTRFFLLSLWFWTSVIVGGVLTVDAPNLPRIMAMLPALPLIMAALLDHLAGQTSRVMERVPLRAARWSRGTYAGYAGAAIVGLAILVAGVQNWYIYVDYYLNTHQNPVVTGQAAYVQAEGPKYRYYGMGAPIIYWTHGDNRFINPNADGVDAGDISTYLPLIDDGVNGEKAANFLVWPPTYDYLPVLRSYYPEATSRTVPLGDAEHLTDPLIGFVVSRSVIDAHRVSHARYTDANGRTVRRKEPSLGSAPGDAPPVGLRYPVRAAWDGDLVAPQYDMYRVEIIGRPGSKLTIDGVPVLSVRKRLATRTVVLARGTHVVHLGGTLESSRQRVEVRWAAVNGPFEPVPRKLLWDGHTGRGWIGEVQPGPAPAGATSLLHPDWRIDGFLGIRNGAQYYGPGPLDGHWSSALTVGHGGPYQLQLNFTGQVTLSVDGRVRLEQVAQGGAPQTATGTVLLKPGRHTFDIRVQWPGPVDILECLYAPPGQQMQIFSARNLQPTGPGVMLRSILPPAPLSRGHA